MDDVEIQDSYTARTVELEQEGGSGQLGTAPPDEDTREEILAKSFLGRKVEGNVRAVHYGKYENHDACLLLAEFRFASRRDHLRFRSATVGFKFKETPAQSSSRSSKLIIRKWNPDHIYGVVNSEQTSSTKNAQAQASAGPVPISASYSWSKQKSTAIEHALEIEAELFKQQTEITFTVRENSTYKVGIPHVVNVGIVILCQQMFEAAVRVHVDAGVGFPVVGAPWPKTKPLKFKPGMNFSTPISPHIDESKHFDQYSDGDWLQLVPYHEEGKSRFVGS